MKFNLIASSLWPMLLVLFMCVSVAQLSGRLKNKTGSYHLDKPHQTVFQDSSSAPMMRVNAMLGGACILLAAFWGFDALLSWWMYEVSS